MIQRLRGKNGKTKGLFIREKSILSKLYYPVRWIIPLTEYRHPIFDNFVNIEGGNPASPRKNLFRGPCIYVMTKYKVKCEELCLVFKEHVEFTDACLYPFFKFHKSNLNESHTRKS